MNVKISTKNYDIINTGCVIVQMGEYLEFEINGLLFRIVFVDNEAEEDGKIQTVIENEGTRNAFLKITFFNQHKAFFSSVSNLSSLAIINKKHLYLKFCIQPINNKEGSSDKIFFYTWYLDKEASTQPTVNASI